MKFNIYNKKRFGIKDNRDIKIQKRFERNEVVRRRNNKILFRC